MINVAIIEPKYHCFILYLRIYLKYACTLPIGNVMKRVLHNKHDTAATIENLWLGPSKIKSLIPSSPKIFAVAKMPSNGLPEANTTFTPCCLADLIAAQTLLVSCFWLFNNVPSISKATSLYIYFSNVFRGA